MHCPYLLALFLFLGVDARKSIDHNPRSNDIIVFPPSEGEGNFPAFTDDLALDPQQLSKLEIILNNVITKYLGPLPAKLSLRSTEDGKPGLAKTVCMIADAICNGIRKLFDKLGLPQSTRRRPSHNEKLARSTNLKVALYYHLMRFPLELSPIWQSAKTQINRHMRRHNYVSMGYKSVKFELQTNRGNSTEEWKFLAIFSAIGIYSTNIYNCLEEKAPSSFDLKQAVGHLTNFPPEMTGKILRSRLGKRLPRHSGFNRAEYNQFHAFVCHAASNDSRLDYGDCLVEIKRVDSCVQTKLNDSLTSDDPVTKSSKDFVRAMKGLDDSCGNVDKELNTSVGCKLKKKATKTNEFPYILDFFMGDLKKSPDLERMARELGSTIKRSQMGSEAMTEIATLIEMYKHGLEKKEQLLKIAEKDVLQRHRYNRMSDHFTRFRQYCLDFANRTVGHLHGAMWSLENVFVDPSLGFARENLTENARALRCWSGFVESIFGSWSHNPGRFPTAPHSVGHNNGTSRFASLGKRRRLPGLIKVPNDSGLIKSSHEEPFKKFIESMKRLGQPRPQRRSSALITLANTFLLATMFYESIAVLAAAIYRQDSGPMSSSISAENEESDRWPPRDRRSPPYLIDQEHLQTQEKTDEEGSLSLTNRTEETTVGTLTSSTEGIQENVDNSTDNEADIDSIESTTISNQLLK